MNECRAPSTSPMHLPVSALEELYGREPVRAAKRISNPGCYATSSQLLLAPLVNHIAPGALPTIFGMSGYSGAGTVMEKDATTGKPISVPKVSPASLGTFVRPYALTGHIHEREAGFHLSTLRTDGVQVKVAFIPAVAPWFSGIVSTVSVPLKKPMSAREVVELFEERYRGERLVKIQKNVVDLSDVEGKHGWTVGGFQMSVEGDRVVITVRIFSLYCLSFPLI